MHSKEKDELCPSFEVEIFTKSLHRGGVLSLIAKITLFSIFNNFFSEKSFVGVLSFLIFLFQATFFVSWLWIAGAEDQS